MKQTEEKYAPLVLTGLSMLKEDTHPAILEGCKKETGFIGVNNFRKTRNIFGLSQPTTEGIHNLVNFYKKKIVWINLREEPVIYINGLPFVLRDKKAPFSNIKSFVGISFKRMEEMEERLKKDIEQLSQKSDGFIKVYTEKTPKTLWLNNMYVREVETVRDIFNRVGNIKYYRIPITRMNSKESFISALDTVLNKIQKKEDYQDYVIGFNSSNGLEKTSYGMSVCLIRELINSEPAIEEQKLSTFSRVLEVLEKVHTKDNLSSFLIKTGNVVPILEKAIKGKYTIIERLIHAMNLADIKPFVNMIFSEIEYNILPALLENVLTFQCYRNRESLKKSGVLLERYISLVLYAIYRKEGIEHSFIDWITGSPIIQGVINEVAIKSPNKNIFLPAVINQKSSTDEEWTAIIGASTVLRADKDQNEILAKKVLKAEKEKDLIIEMHQPNIDTDLSFLKTPAIWINLRAEPIVYIEGVPHSERERIEPNHNIKAPSGITDELVNNQEEILIRRIQNEGSQLQGEILLFVTESNKIKTKRANVKEKKVQTCREFISELKMVNYMRIPMISKAPLNPNIVDMVYAVLASNNGMPVILQATGYLGRTRIIKTLADVIRRTKEMQSKKDVLDRLARPVLIRSIETLIRILCNGIVSEIIVREAWTRIEGKDIYDMYSTGHLSSKHLINYILLISLASYILEESTISFRKWINQRKDILNLYKSIEDIENTLEIDSVCNLDEQIQKNIDMCVENKTELINRPWGQVLTPHTILKNDFFPALRVLQTDTIDIKGCCNFRTVEFNEDITVGLAQPTAWGVQSLVEYFNPSEFKVQSVSVRENGAHEYNARNREVHWFCLRQEPVVYVNGFPFVLRTTDLVYENVITEGINRKWVEDMEERMKNDCIEESAKEGLILHNEVIIDNEAELSAEKATGSSILTPKEVFVNRTLKYYRMPISDEQTPLPEIFDELHKIILSIPKPRILVFSCQMGRGRTTTGMVIARLIAFTESLNEASSDSRKRILEEKRSQVVYEDQYRVISKLIQVLPMGRESKNLVDSIIKECSHIQNIYEAIAQRKDNTGYLIRYFYLVCFGSFLLEKEEKTFARYLSDRIEIDVIANEREY
ncbi:hypothetical protein NEMIN01_1608 [Nematocida minor]|uniref:uncharacterized protein n=1 Tax=Nematocida minor TaxID=1912983 RepID=UPI00221FB8AA|nr:uncharacterized protein NEMIN01_1608 [Nematocida minor]KAI5191624.1 hypothetical protein NEMIN01_1608 [Nematocida minor]